MCAVFGSSVRSQESEQRKRDERYMKDVCVCVCVCVSWVFPMLWRQNIPTRILNGLYDSMSSFAFSLERYKLFVLR